MTTVRFLLVTLLLIAGKLRSQEVIFQDDFRGKFGPGWSWIREHQRGWRLTEHGLEVRIEPGNMWGPQNNARNLLVRAAPEPGDSELEISVNVENNPSNQYEQVDLVWYYDDSNMVKLGQELVDGKLSVVMGREEKDKTRTISITPLDSTDVQLRLIVRGLEIQGQFLSATAKKWQTVGQCDIPPSANERPKISLQCYQGKAEVEHWARISEFKILKRK